MSKILKTPSNCNKNVTMSTFEIICDRSKEKLTEIPKDTLTKTHLKMLFLEGNDITSLPSDLFLKLPQLTWLDLRNNKLSSIPKSVKDHKCLECLFLTNNLLKHLPNELGLVSTLKALQVANNPLVYPPRQVVAQGTQEILNYLRKNYNDNEISGLVDTQEFTKSTVQNSNQSNTESKSESKTYTEPSSTQQQVDTLSTLDSIKSQSKLSQNHLRQEMCSLLLASAINKINPIIQSKSISRTESSVKESVQSISSSFLSSKRSRESLKKKLAPDKQFPIHVKSLSKCTSRSKDDAQSSEKIVHKIYRHPDSITIKSYFNKINDKLDRRSNNVDPAIKEAWMNNLRVLLADQERILQQERNLRTLTKWRKTKKQNFNALNPSLNLVNPPFGIYEEFFKMMTREELQMQLENYLRQRCSPMVNNNGFKDNPDIENSINELMKQLKIIDNHNGEPSDNSPRTEIKLADQQIQLIMDIQKKLLLLKRNLSV